MAVLESAMIGVGCVVIVAGLVRYYKRITLVPPNSVHSIPSTTSIRPSYSSPDIYVYYDYRPK